MPWDPEYDVISAPSMPINIVDIAGPQKMHTKFVYNYYVPDEPINQSGYEQADTSDSNLIASTTSGMYSLYTGNNEEMQDVRYRINRQVPRYVNVTIETEHLAVMQTGNDNQTAEQRLENLGIGNASEVILQNLARAHDDSSLSAASPSRLFISISLQDNNLVWETGNEILFTNDLRSSTDDSIVKQLSNMEGEYSKNILPIATYEAWWRNAKDKLNSTTAVASDPGVLPGAYPDEDTSAQCLNGQIAQHYYADLLMAGMSNAVSPFAHDFSSDIQQAIEIQVNALTPAKHLTTWSDFGPIEYQVPIAPITQAGMGDIKISALSSLESPPWNNNEVLPLGYVLEKYESFGDGTRFQHKPIIIGNSKFKTGVDTSVRVGASYFYQVRAAYLVRLTVMSEQPAEGGPWAITSLFLSKPSVFSQVVCNPPPIPPDPPGDIKFTYNYDDGNLAIHWAFPVTPQRDIKYFQIYRRSSFLEPFQLLKEYDFNDRVQRNLRDELRRPDLIEIQGGVGLKPRPKTYYIDDEFDKNSKFIYALVSVDAQELRSNYSTQFQVYFDRFTNNIVVEDVSPAGAHRDYPNYFLNPLVDGVRQETVITEDAIKVSKHEEVEIYLNPTAIRIIKPGEAMAGKESITDVNAAHLVFASTTGGPPGDPLPQYKGIYKMQIINVDNGKAKNIDIGIADERTVILSGPNPFAVDPKGEAIPHDPDAGMFGEFQL